MATAPDPGTAPYPPALAASRSPRGPRAAPAEVAGLRPCEQRVFLARARTDVVDHQRPARAVGGLAVGHDADVRQVAGQAPADDVAGPEVGGLERAAQREAAPAEVRLEVEHAP